MNLSVTLETWTQRHSLELRKPHPWTWCWCTLPCLVRCWREVVFICQLINLNLTWLADELRLRLPTVSDNRLEVNFCVSVPTVELDTPAASKQLLPALNWSNWINQSDWIKFIKLNQIDQSIKLNQSIDQSSFIKLTDLYISTLDFPPNCFPLRYELWDELM